MPSPVASSIPSTPLQTPFTGPLVSNERYRLLTGDTDTPDDDITSVMADVETDVARRLNRTLRFGQYTERLYVYKLGYTYPSAIPISQVDAPFSSTQQGASEWIGFYLPLPEMPVWSGVLPPQSDVTYWGGFDDTTIPPKLAKCIAKVAWYRLHPTVMKNIPGGVMSVHVGSIGFSGASELSQMTETDPELRRDLAAFTRRTAGARAWQK